MYPHKAHGDDFSIERVPDSDFDSVRSGSVSSGTLKVKPRLTHYFY